MKRLALNERDLRALRIFKSVALAGGFSAAEKVLCMTTATISRHIKDIEERIGTRLCTRGPQGFALTEAGEVALDRVQDALDAIDRILPAIDKTRDILSGELRVGVLDNVINNPDCHLGEAIKILTREAPDVAVSVHTVSKKDVVKLLMDNKFHIIISGSFHPVSALCYEYLFNEIQTIYFLPSDKDPHDLPLIFRPVQNVLTDVMQSYGYCKGPDADGLQSVAFFISTGHFVGMLPTHYVDQLSAILPLKGIPDAPVHTIPFYAITNPARPLPMCAERFIAILKDCHSATA